MTSDETKLQVAALVPCQICGSETTCVLAYNQGGYDNTSVCFSCLDGARQKAGQPPSVEGWWWCERKPGWWEPLLVHNPTSDGLEVCEHGPLADFQCERWGHRIEAPR